MNAAATISHVLVERPRAGLRRSLRAAEWAAGAVCGLAILLFAGLLLATVVGYQPLVEHSGSMSPAIAPGDLLITHDVPAASVRIGEIVSFDDPALGGKLVTHRVVAMHTSAERVDFLTRGDANKASESWSVARRGSVEALDFRVAGVGRAIAWMTDPWARTVMLALVALVLSAALLRRIWRA
jgi:signal peptidase I